MIQNFLFSLQILKKKIGSADTASPSLFAVSEILDRRRIIPPIFFDLHPGLEVHLRPHEPLHILAGQGGHLFQHGASLADDDALVAVLFTVDGGVDLNDLVIPLGEFGDLHRRAVGDLLVQTGCADQL